MLSFPASTEYGKRIPKQKFYDHLSVAPALKSIFTEQIESIVWRNKLSPATINVAKGEQVDELQVFLIKLRQRSLDNAVLELIDRGIPYHILFLLESNGLFQARIGYKEAIAGKNACKVDAYYQSDWLPWEQLPLSLSGLNMDAVYGNFARLIAGDSLAIPEATTMDSLKSAVECDKQRQKLRKQIAALEKKIQREKQFNKQVELNANLKQLRAALENI